MATHSINASQLKYASSSSWTSGLAKQGLYSSTRYEGAIRFTDLANFDMSNINITQIKLKITISESGMSGSKYFTMYKAAKNAISGTIASMRGSSIGSILITNAYGTTKTLTFDSKTNASMFNTLKSYFLAGNQTLIMYVPSTRGMPDGKVYCYDYMSVSAATLTFTFDYLKSSGTLESSSIVAGSTAKMNITAYNAAYTHKVTWSFGNHTYEQSIAAGTTSTSYAIPLSWLDAIPSATSGTASATLETFDTAGNSLGSSITNFTVTVPESVVPTFTSVTVTPINSNSVINGWKIFVYGKSQATIAINGASGIYGSTITSYSITTSPSVGGGTSASITTSTLQTTGTITVTASIVDSRGRSASKQTTFNIYPYNIPSFTSVTAYRCNSGGTQDDVSGTYVCVNAVFKASELNGNNKVTATATLTQVNGTYSTSANLTSGTRSILGGGNISTDSTYKLTITLKDTVGTTHSVAYDIASAAYIIHVKKGGKAMGIGCAASKDNTLSIGWELLMPDAYDETLPSTGTEGQIRFAPNTENIFDLIYPVGSIYMSVNAVNPTTLFGGTWVQIEDTFLLAAGSIYAAGSTGGEATHTLTVAEIPSHSHHVRTQGSETAQNALTYTSQKNRLAGSGTLVQNTGGGQPHNNMPPYLAVHVWQRTA